MGLFHPPQSFLFLASDAKDVIDKQGSISEGKTKEVAMSATTRRKLIEVALPTGCN